VHQVAEQLLLVRRSGMVEMLERSLPLDAAEERAGIRKDHDPGAGARQGKGQHVRILGESYRPVGVTARQAEQSDTAFTMPEISGHADLNS